MAQSLSSPRFWVKAASTLIASGVAMKLLLRGSRSSASAFPAQDQFTLFTNPACPFAQRALLVCAHHSQNSVQLVFIPLSQELLDANDELRPAVLPPWAPKHGVSSPKQLHQLKETYKAFYNKSGAVPCLLAQPRAAERPTVQHGDLSDVLGERVAESAVVMQRLDLILSDNGEWSSSLYPNDAAIRSNCDSAAKALDPAIDNMYRLLKSQNPEEDEGFAKGIRDGLAAFTRLCSSEGPFFNGSQVCFVDYFLAPFVWRFSQTLKHYRKWDLLTCSSVDSKNSSTELDTKQRLQPEMAARFMKWWQAMLFLPAMKATSLDKEKFMRIYQHYANKFHYKTEAGRIVFTGREISVAFGK